MSYHGASSDEVGARASRPTKCNTPETTIANVLDDFELVFKAQWLLVGAGRPAAVRVIRDSHGG